MFVCMQALGVSMVYDCTRQSSLSQRVSLIVPESHRVETVAARELRQLFKAQTFLHFFRA